LGKVGIRGLAKFGLVILKQVFGRCSVRAGDGQNPANPAVAEESPDDIAMSSLAELSKRDLLEHIRQQREAGVRIGFPGKNKARRIARRVQPRVVRMLTTYSVGSEEDQARNLVVEGENLQALTTLYRERGQVDLVLTDPPYNTGKDFRYNDRWDDDPNDPNLGEVVSEEDGARHTKWMKFMWPRLQLMKDMLKPNGVLAICIDHRELFRLGQALDELFKEENRLGILNWERASTRRNDQQHVSTGTEYVLVYAKDKDLARTGLEERSAELDAGYTNPDNDPEGDWSGVSPFAPGRATHPGMVYAVQSPFTGELIYPPGTRCWANEKPQMKAMLERWGSTYVEVDLNDGFPAGLLLRGATDPRTIDPKTDPAVKRARRKAELVRDKGPWPPLFFTKEGFGQPRRKAYISKVRKGVVPSTFWADEEFVEPMDIGCTSWEATQSGTTESASRELAAIVGDHGFETVKPTKLFQKVIQLWCPPNGLVLDPFAGSGTTGHAVFALNAQVSSARRFILIEQGRPEKGDPYARSLCANRLRRVIAGRWENGKGESLGGGFRFVSLQKRVDAKAVLSMARDEMADAVIASYFDDSKRGPTLVNMESEALEYLVARNPDEEGFFLVWDGSKRPPVFDEKVYDSIVKEARTVGLKPTYHVYARFNLYQSDDVRFYQIPNRILMDFGVSTTTDAFHEEGVVPVDLD